MKKTVESLTKSYNRDILELVRLYEAGYNQSHMADDLNMTVGPLRTAMAALNLRAPKKFRDSDARIFWERYNNAPEAAVDQALRDDLSFAQAEVGRLYKEVTKQRNVSNTLRSGLRKDAREETLINTILTGLRHSIDPTPISVEVCATPANVTTGRQVMLLSDLHIGSEVSPDETSGNVFNYDVAEMRLDAYVDAVINAPQRSDSINVMMLGDLFEGIIHHNVPEGGMMESLIKAQRILTKQLAKLSAVYRRVIVDVVEGNHSRLTQQVQQGSGKFKDFEYLLANMLETTLHAAGISNVTFTMAENGYFMRNVCGANILGHHGDRMRSYNPASATSRRQLQEIALGTFGENYNVAVSGHTHCPSVVDNGTYGGCDIVAGSLVGVSEYGQTSGFTNIRASQTHLFIDEFGSVSGVYQVELDHLV